MVKIAFNQIPKLNMKTFGRILLLFFEFFMLGQILNEKNQL